MHVPQPLKLDYEFRDRASGSFNRTVRLKEHFGQPVLVETKQIKMAVVRKNPGDPIERAIVIHPRYVPLGMPHEIMEFEGWRHGRSVTMLLPKPRKLGGEIVTILDFKGCGADAQDEFDIHPNLWFDNGFWIERPKGEHRIWGGVRKSAGEEEFAALVLKMIGAPMVPYLSLNAVPSKISQEIAGIQTGSVSPRLVQLVRGLRTNIRCSVLNHAGFGSEGFNTEIGELASRISPLLNGPVFAEGDARLFTAQLALAMFGKRILFNGYLEDNRFIDGRFTDDENFGIRRYRGVAVSELSTEIVASRLPYLLWNFDKDTYAKWATGAEIELDTGQFRFMVLLGEKHEIRIKLAVKAARDLRGRVDWNALSYDHQCAVMHGLWEGNLNLQRLGIGN